MIKRITLRLSLEKSEDKAIADYLSNIGKTKYSTLNKAIKAILYEAISGTSSKKTETKNIISVIRTTLETEISRLFSVFVSDNKPAEKTVEAVEDDDIDMQYVGR